MGQSQSTFSVKIREVSSVNLTFCTEGYSYHYSVHPDQAPFCNRNLNANNSFAKNRGKAFTVYGITEDEFFDKLIEYKDSGSTSAEVMTNLKADCEMSPNWTLGEIGAVVLGLLSGIVAIGEAVLKITDR